MTWGSDCCTCWVCCHCLSYSLIYCRACAVIAALFPLSMSYAVAWYTCCSCRTSVVGTVLYSCSIISCRIICCTSRYQLYEHCVYPVGCGRYMLNVTLQNLRSRHRTVFPLVGMYTTLLSTHDVLVRRRLYHSSHVNHIQCRSDAGTTLLRVSPLRYAVLNCCTKGMSNFMNTTFGRNVVYFAQYARCLHPPLFISQLTCYDTCCACCTCCRCLYIKLDMHAALAVHTCHNEA